MKDIITLVLRLREETESGGDADEPEHYVPGPKLGALPGMVTPDTPALSGRCSPSFTEGALKASESLHFSKAVRLGCDAGGIRTQVCLGCHSVFFFFNPSQSSGAWQLVRKAEPRGFQATAPLPAFSFGVNTLQEGSWLCRGHLPLLSSTSSHCLPGTHHGGSVQVPSSVCPPRPGGPASSAT